MSVGDLHVKRLLHKLLKTVKMKSVYSFLYRLCGVDGGRMGQQQQLEKKWSISIAISHDWAAAQSICFLKILVFWIFVLLISK